MSPGLTRVIRVLLFLAVVFVLIRFSPLLIGAGRGVAVALREFWWVFLILAVLLFRRLIRVYRDGYRSGRK